MLLLKKITNNFFNKNFFWLTLLLIIITIPNGSSKYFNGLPWNQNIETLFIVIVLPILLIFNKKINFDFYSKIIISLVITIKLLNVFSPSFGINHKQYINNSKNNDFVISYDTFWNKNFTTIQKFSWNKKRQFPLEWINFSDNTFYPEFFASVDWDNININHNVNFYLFVKDKANFKIETNQINNDYLKYYNLSEKLVNKFYVNNNDGINLTEGIYSFSGNLNFSGNDIKLIPYIITNEKQIKAIENGYIFSDLNKIENLNIISLYKYSSNLSDILLFFLFVYLILNIFILSFDKKYTLTFVLSIFSVFSYIFLFNYLNFFLSLIGTYDYVGIWPLALTYTGLLFIVILFQLNKNFIKQLEDNLSFQNVFIIISPVFFIFWVFQFKNDLQSFSFWTVGDDWSGFQYFARKIVLENDWLRGGEGIFYFRPLIRYLIAFQHILFGDSSFALKFIDVWSIIISSLIVYKLLKLKNCSNYLSFIALLIILIIFTGENFRYLVGRGLSEYFGMLIMMLFFYYLYDNKIYPNFKLILLALIISIIPYTREEKIFVAIALIFLTINFQEIKEKKQNIFSTLITFFSTNYKNILIYISVLFLMFPVLFEFRNYMVEGYFSLTSHEFVNQGTFQGGFNSYYKMLTAETYPNFPRVTSIFLISSFFISLLIIIIPKYYKLFDIRFSIILLSIIIPTIFHEIHAYNPRYVIYSLPLSVLILFYFINTYFKKLR